MNWEKFKKNWSKLIEILKENSCILLILSAFFLAGWTMTGKTSGGAALCLALIISAIITYFAIDQCAKANFLFTYVEEGTAKAIMSGSAFERIVFVYKGAEKMFMNQKWQLYSREEVNRMTNKGDITEFPGAEEYIGNQEELENHLEKRHHAIDEFLRTNYLARKLFGKNNGLRWIGLPPYHQVHEYKFTWASKTVQGEEKRRKEKIDSILIQEDIYLMKLESVEDKNLIPLNISILVTLRIVNPYKALFRVQNWLEMITNTLRGICVPYIGSQGLAEMISGTEDDSSFQGKGALADYIWHRLTAEEDKPKTNDTTETKKSISERQRFINDYGVRIKEKGIRVESIDPPAAYAKEITQGAMRPWISQREAKAINKRYKPFVGETSIDQIQDPGQKEKAAERMMEIRRLEALEKISEGGNLILDIDKTKGLIIDTKKGDKK